MSSDPTTTTVDLAKYLEIAAGAIARAAAAGDYARVAELFLLLSDECLRQAEKAKGLVR